MGRLAVTDEEPDRYPGLLKCYWMVGSNQRDPWTFLDPSRITGFTLISRPSP
jgi:hypothetical protein